MAQSIDDIRIRTDIEPGDLGEIIRLHGVLYAREYGYGVTFESYVAGGISEFYRNYNPERDRFWICEHHASIAGTILLMHRPGNAAQLRYFLVTPEYRGIGLGKKLMELYMDFLRRTRYRSSYLWTTHELTAASRLYALHGFRLTEEKDSTAFGKAVREQRYEIIVEGGNR